MARLGLARHVFVCRDEDYVVVLDLKQDRYFALEAAPTAPLGLVLPGWPVSTAGNAPTESEVSQVAAPLMRRGWVLAAGAETKLATPAKSAVPEGELTGEADAGNEKLAVRTVIAFVMASVFAKFALRFWPFERVIRRVAERNAKHAGATRALDLERARKLVRASERMRAFLFSTRDECLHDSLAVLEFLARYQLFPSWVFGVRARPFAAHCWVQHDGFVCNDTVEHVSGYVPIMVV
jgi:hypothetical protein